MDQNRRADTNCSASPSIIETSHYAESSQPSTSLTPAQRQTMAEADSDNQIMVGKTFPREQYSGEEHRLSLKVPTQLMQNKNDHQEPVSQGLESAEATVEQHDKDGQEDNAVGSPGPETDILRSRVPTAWVATNNKTRYGELIEEAVSRGQPSKLYISPEKFQPPRLSIGGGKWQSTLVTLTVEGREGGAYGGALHYFNTDLWRYGGRVSALCNPTWHEVDSIDLKVRLGHIQVILHQNRIGRSTTWSWSWEQDCHFHMQVEHIHLVEMVCGYLNFAAGCDDQEAVDGTFGDPHGSTLVSHSEFWWYLGSSFVGPFLPRSLTGADTSHTEGTIDPTLVVEALTRVHGEPIGLVVPAKKRHKDDCLATAGCETDSIEVTLVRLPSVWSVCRDSACVCGDSVMVLDTTHNQVRELGHGEQYLAISYVWTQHDEKSLLSFIQRAVEVTGVGLVWVDRLCINQTCDQHKATQIPRMREVYQKGYATVALVPDITATLEIMFYTPTAIVPWETFSLTTRSFREQVRHCAWRTRCWTWQEGLLGSRGYYVTEKQVLPARIVSDVLGEFGLDGKQPEVGTCTMTGLMSLGVRSLRCNVQTWGQKICIGELLDAEDHELIEYWLIPQTKSLGAALRLTRDRIASRQEDEIYSVLGMIPQSKALKVVYGESRNAILGRAVNEGLVGAEILCSDSVSSRDGESWAAKDDTSKHVGHIYRLSQEIRGPVEVDGGGLKYQFHRLEGLAGVSEVGGELRLFNSKKEVIGSWAPDGGGVMLRNLVSCVDQVLLLGETSGTPKRALIVNGTGGNVVRMATGRLWLEPWMKVETEVVWRVVG